MPPEFSRLFLLPRACVATRHGQVAFAKNLFDLDVVIREKPEVTGPAFLHRLFSCHFVAVRVDECVIVAHQGSDFFKIVGINSGSEVCDDDMRFFI